MDNHALSVEAKDRIIAFADKYLGEYKLHEGRDGTQLTPRYCPLCKGGSHGDQNTFTINLDYGLYVCKRGSCGKSGWVEDLMSALGEDAPALERKRKPGLEQPQAKQYVLPTTPLSPCTDAIYDYFKLRCISRETVDAFKIQADEKGNIVFPFFENGERVFEKFRVPKKHKGDNAPKEWRSPGTKPILFGMDMCVFSKPLTITEGEIDAMSLYEAGIRNVVSVPSGCEDMAWVDLCWTWLERFKTIILFGDNDEPGRRMVKTLCKRLDESRCQIVEEYPERPDGVTPCKDANEILYFYGPFKLMEVAMSSREVPIKGLIDLSEVTPIDPTTIPRIRTNIPKLDKTIGGLQEGAITIFSGKAGDGKSTLSGQLLLAAIEQGYSVCAYSGELPKEQFQQWINFQAAGSDWIGLKYDPVEKQQVPCLDWAVQERIMKWYAGKFFLFDNNEIFEHNQSQSIIEVFTMAARRYGCKLFLVDNMMTSLADVEEETRAQAKFISALKKFATRFSVHILVVAHPRKTKAGETLRKDDVGGNSAIVNLADSAIVIERPNLRVIKNRKGGSQPLIECCYCGDSRRIYQADAGDLNVFSWDKEGLAHPPVRADSLPEYGVQFSNPDPF